jgi:hypothetical protein
MDTKVLEEHFVSKGLKCVRVRNWLGYVGGCSLRSKEGWSGLIRMVSKKMVNCFSSVMLKANRLRNAEIIQCIRLILCLQLP